MKRNIIRTIFVIILILFSSIGMFTTSSISEGRYEQTDTKSSDLEEPTSSLADSPWPMFNQNRNHTSVSPYSTHGVNGTVGWKFSTGNSIYSSPAIGGDGTIYVGSNDHNLYAINSNGTEKWLFETNGEVTSSPAIGNDGTIYIGSKDHRLYAIHKNGTQRWNVSLGDEITYSSPNIGNDGTIYLGTTNTTEDNFFAIYPNGTKKWSLNTNGAVLSSPSIRTDGAIYIGSGEKVYCIDQDGNIEWFYETGGLIYSSPTIGSNKEIYIGSADEKVYSIDHQGELNWVHNVNGEVYSSPALAKDGTIYVTVDYGSIGGSLIALNQEGGEPDIQWGIYREGLDMFPSPAVSADGVIYAGAWGCACTGTDYEFMAVNPEGEIKWEARTIVSSSPAIGWDGTVYVAGGSRLWAFESEMDIRINSLLNKSNTVPDKDVKINGSAFLSNGVAPAGADVLIDINDAVTYNTTLMEDGTFEKTFKAPMEVGNYTINVTIDSEEYDVSNSTFHHLRVTSTPKPDIALTSIKLHPIDTDYYKDDTINVEVTVKNLGSAYTDLDISMSINEIEDIISTKNMNLSSGGKTVCEFTTIAVSGDHKIWIRAHNISDDDNLNNNIINATYTAEERKPSIGMGVIETDIPEIVWEGDMIDLKTEIWNEGSLDVNTSILFFIDNDNNHSKWFDLELGVDQKESIEVEWDAVNGIHTLWFIVDPNGTIDEENKINSTRNITISVLKKTSEISVSNLRISPEDDLYVGDEITVSGVIENKGTVSSDFDVVFSVDEKDNITGWRALYLGANESKTIDFSYTLSSSSQVVWLIADYNDSVEENLESDNTAYKIVEASQPESTGDQEHADTENEGEEDAIDTDDESGFPYWILVIISAVVLSVILLIYWKEEDEDEGEDEEEEITSSED
ncbi:MAG: PQQ-binding-like beta-propeller repeat protein [Thermoplasmatota archaeon]